MPIAIGDEIEIRRRPVKDDVADGAAREVDERQRGVEAEALERRRAAARAQLGPQGITGDDRRRPADARE